MPLHEPTLFDPNDGDSGGPSSPQLEEVRPVLGADSEANPEASTTTESAVSTETRHRRRQLRDPGNIVLLHNIGPNNPELASYDPHSFELLSEASSEDPTAMTEHAEASGAKEEPSNDHAVGSPAVDSGFQEANCKHSRGPPEAMVDANALEAQATEALKYEAKSRKYEDAENMSFEDEFRPEQKSLPQLAPEGHRTCSGQTSPLKLVTEQVPREPKDTIATSPLLQHHVITASKATEGTLPALQQSPTRDGAGASPQTEKLPSFRQLSELAAVAEQHDPRVNHQHSQSFGSATAQSPMLPYHYPHNSAQTSPSSHYTHSARSPSSTIVEYHYASPTQLPPQTYYTDRRSSVATDHTTPLPALLPSASSSGESGGHTSSSADGCSTAHTTPVDAPPTADGTPRPLLPPPPGMPQSAVMIATGYKCSYPGCSAVPFQTQYLLRYAICCMRVSSLLTLPQLA